MATQPLYVSTITFKKSITRPGRNNGDKTRGIHVCIFLSFLSRLFTTRYSTAFPLARAAVTSHKDFVQVARSRGRDRINRASNPQTVAKTKQETTKEAGLDSAAFLSTPIHAHTKLPTQAHGACVRWARTRRRKELCARAPERKKERER